MSYDMEAPFQEMLSRGEREEQRRTKFAEFAERRIRSDLIHARGLAAEDVLENIGPDQLQRVLALAFETAMKANEPQGIAVLSIFNDAIAALVAYRVTKAESEGEFEDDEPDDHEG